MCFSGVNLPSFSEFLETFAKLSTSKNWEKKTLVMICISENK
jgi:hypothetical protein